MTNPKPPCPRLARAMAEFARRQAETVRVMPDERFVPFSNGGGIVLHDEKEKPQ